MAVTSGFFNSINHDRLYDAEQLSSIFDGIIIDGVYENYGKAFKVETCDSPDTVLVRSGRAWFNHTWILNDSDMALELPKAHQAFDRIDAIVLDINSETDVRENKILVIEGAVSQDSSVKPSLIDTPSHSQYPIAYITRRASSEPSIISQEDINMTVGSDSCPIVTSVLEAQSLENIYLQLKTEFNIWWDSVKEIISSEGVLELKDKIEKLESGFEELSGSVIKYDKDALKNYNSTISIKSYNLKTDTNKDYYVFSGTNATPFISILPNGNMIFFKRYYETTSDFSPFRYRLKFKITVETPEGVVVGSEKEITFNNLTSSSPDRTSYSTVIKKSGDGYPAKYWISGIACDEGTWTTVSGKKKKNVFNLYSEVIEIIVSDDLLISTNSISHNSIQYTHTVTDLYAADGYASLQSTTLYSPYDSYGDVYYGLAFVEIPIRYASYDYLYSVFYIIYSLDDLGLIQFLNAFMNVPSSKYVSSGENITRANNLPGADRDGEYDGIDDLYAGNKYSLTGSDGVKYTWLVNRVMKTADGNIVFSMHDRLSNSNSYFVILNNNAKTIKKLTTVNDKATVFPSDIYEIFRLKWYNTKEYTVLDNTTRFLKKIKTIEYTPINSVNVETFICKYLNFPTIAIGPSSNENTVNIPEENLFGINRQMVSVYGTTACFEQFEFFDSDFAYFNYYTDFKEYEGSIIPRYDKENGVYISRNLFSAIKIERTSHVGKNR